MVLLVFVHVLLLVMVLLFGWREMVEDWVEVKEYEADCCHVGPVNDVDTATELVRDGVPSEPLMEAVESTDTDMRRDRDRRCDGEVDLLSDDDLLPVTEGEWVVERLAADRATDSDTVAENVSSV